MFMMNMMKKNITLIEFIEFIDNNNNNNNNNNKYIGDIRMV
ncbi:hypothetical protein MGK_02582 [Candida albicans P57055]|nr:hypothetical protein MGK_02582 [Candida albicans P57055]